MTILNTLKREIKPTHPGEMLRDDFLPDYGLTPEMLAKALDVPISAVNELLNEQSSMTPAMALRLSKLFGNTAKFWLNAQQAVDLWYAEQKIRESLAHIRPLAA
jgi:addiction module HigA family antidote